MKQAIYPEISEAGKWLEEEFKKKGYDEGFIKEALFMFGKFVFSVKSDILQSENKDKTLQELAEMYLEKIKPENG